MKFFIFSWENPKPFQAKLILSLDTPTTSFLWCVFLPRTVFLPYEASGNAWLYTVSKKQLVLMAYAAH